jgi:carbamoyl-phosphate synthase small subunit
LVVAYDFGIKRNILRLLVSNGFRVHVVPASTPASEVEKLAPAGIFLSNGPGDPDAVPYAIQAVRELSPNYPIFGICLGHQILGLALGARTYKLKFGHRGANHPVQEFPSKRVEVSSQNHGFAVDASSLPEDLEISHVNLNDQTVSGMRHRSLPLFSVQYHPEASPGPHDSGYLFGQFVESVHGRTAVRGRS